MSRPTIAELTEQLAEQRAKARDLATRLENLDPEAKAYHYCVKALDAMPSKSDRGSYAMASPSKASIRRVIRALEERYELTESVEVELNTWEPDPDPRDQFISMLVDALKGNS